MKHISLAKIIVALCICNVYLFTCGVMGVVKSSADSAPIENTEQIVGNGVYTDSTEEAYEEHQGFGTVDFITPDAEDTETVHIEQMRFESPKLADRPVQSTYIPTDKEPELVTYETDAETEETDDAFVIIDTYEPEEIEPVQPEQPSTTAPEVTLPPADTAPATTTTDSGIKVDDTPSTTTTANDLPQQPTEIITDTDAANEILYVTSGGMTVSGTALDIVSRVTQNEMGYTFAPEAIKAQAVAAYTYIKYCNKYGSYPSVALSETVNDSVRVLTQSVIGQAVYYDNSYIQAVYSASSAGYTASSENVWGNAYPYLTSVYCELDALYDPNYGRKVTFSSDDIKSRVYSKTGISLTGDPSEWFSIDSRVDGNYVGQLNIGGYHSYTDSDGDTVKITGRVFRERIMSFDIRSSAFDISYDASTDLFTITTYGYGHGVGMSQNGANNLATYWGWDYKQILEFYYTGATVY